MDPLGRSVLITGASSGIGAATARLLASEGAHLCLVARNAARLRILCEQLVRGGTKAIAVALDITLDGAPEHAVRQCTSALGTLDILINNAGRGIYMPLAGVPLDSFRELLELNVVAPLRFMQAAIGPMRANGGGVIVNIGSNAARMQRPGVGAYASTKAALEVMSAIAGVEFANDFIRVITVSPGRTLSDFGRNAIRSGYGAAADAGLSPDGDPPSTAEFVAGRILAAIRAEVRAASAPIRSGTLRVEPTAWDLIGH